MSNENKTSKNYIEDKLKLLEKRMDILEELIQTQSRKIVQKYCKHDFVIRGSWSGSYCRICGKHGGWYCLKSPDHQCYYSKTRDQCDFCGQPEERK